MYPPQNPKLNNNLPEYLKSIDKRIDSKFSRNKNQTLNDDSFSNTNNNNLTKDNRAKSFTMLITNKGKKGQLSRNINRSMNSINTTSFERKYSQW